MENRFGIFTQLINNINRNIYKLKLNKMEAVGLKSTHVSCLYYLYTDKHLTLGELCEKCDENKSAISRTVEYLTQNGYVEKTAKEAKYKVPLSLTNKGLGVGKYIKQKITSLVNRAGLGLSVEQRDTMYQCLRTINQNLQNINEKKNNSGSKVNN